MITWMLYWLMKQPNAAKQKRNERDTQEPDTTLIDEYGQIGYLTGMTYGLRFQPNIRSGNPVTQDYR